MNDQHHIYMREAIRLSQEGMTKGAGGPFGCVIVKDGEIVGRGHNQVTSTNDPTAHAEVVAIRDACARLGTFQLTGCVVYTSCEPCPMCLGAIYWARPEKIYFANARKDAADIDFDDDFIYQEIGLDVATRSIPSEQVLRDEGNKVFQLWREVGDKTLY